MSTYGAPVCTTDLNTTWNINNAQTLTYYDGERVFYQLADYLGNTVGPPAGQTWYTCAVAAQVGYRDNYVLAVSPVGATNGYTNFAYGITENYLRTGDTTSYAAVNDLASNSVWCVNSSYNTTNIALDNQIRENSYCGDTFLDQGRMTGTYNSRVTSEFEANSKQQLTDMFVTYTAPLTKPFMVSLAAEFLIRYENEYQADAAIDPLLQKVADGLWAHYWDPFAEAFFYIDNPIPGDQPHLATQDLNLLIMPLYAWLYHQGYGTKYYNEAMQIFHGGVVGNGSTVNPSGAYLGAGKQFDQNYKWSIKGVQWLGLQ